MTRLLLVRHGQTDWNYEGRYQGQADPPLNHQGRTQAQALAAQLTGEPLSAIYSSDLHRALETAQIIARGLAVPIQVDARLREIKLGRWEGMLYADIQAQYPALWWAREQDPVHVRAPDGENVAELTKRVYEMANEISARYTSGQVLVVTHGLVISVLKCRVLGIPMEQSFSHIPGNTHLILLEWDPAG